MNRGIGILSKLQRHASTERIEMDDEREFPKLKYGRHRCYCLHSWWPIHRRQKCFYASWFTVMLALFCCWGLLTLYYDVEKRIVDPYWQAALYMPIRTIWVKYIAKRPSNKVRAFSMLLNNSFVIHLTADITRWDALRRTNANNRNLLDRLHRFEAWVWLPPHQAEQDPLRAQRQEQYKRRYPQLIMWEAAHKYGDAGCFLSHVLLMEQLLASSDISDDYYFCFEDDIHFTSTFAASNGSVVAPDDAHVVFLPPFATKLVALKDSATKTTARRVIQGYGALGYVITRHGAQLLLEYLQSHRVHFDVALAGAVTALHVYLPMMTMPMVTQGSTSSWPMVEHAPRHGSTRRAINQQGKDDFKG